MKQQNGLIVTAILASTAFAAGAATDNGISVECGHGRMQICYDGATVTSWRPAALVSGKDVFFMPRTTPWGKEVHGGVPICWPWIGRREGMPKHGLVRYMKWRFVRRIDQNGAEFETASTPETMKIWPHPFTLRATFVLADTDSLEIVVTETNTGTRPYESAFGVHPYFAMGDACNKVALDGNVLPKPWVIKDLAADGKPHRLDDLEWKRSVTVSASDNDAWFVWNPGTERTPLCETLDPDEWLRFYCLEPVMKTPLTLAPGTSRMHRVQIKFAATESRLATAGGAPSAAKPAVSTEPIFAKYRLDAKSNLYPVGGKANVEAYVADKHGKLTTNGLVDVWVDDGWTNVVWRRTVNLAEEPRIKMSFTRATPGSLRIYMKGRDIPVRQRMERMIFGVNEIKPLTPCPDDFEAYWRGEQARLEREVPIAVEKVPAPKLGTKDHKAYYVSFATFNGGRIYGLLLVPNGDGRFPAMVNVPGAGPGTNTIFPSKQQLVRKGWITLLMNIHGIPLTGTDAEYHARYKKWFADYAGKVGEPRYQYVGYAESREAPFYHRNILGMTRALDWLAKEPYADASRFVYYGCSQGGGFGLYLTALWGRFAKSLILCPNKCDMLAYREGRQPGSSHIMNQKPENRERAEKNAVYHDNCNFAAMIHTPVRMVYGTADDNCQTIGGIAAFNRIASKDKQLRLLPGKGHGWMPAGFDKWLFDL